jgi:hypothetical protein
MIYLIIQDFQHTASDGQILTLKKGTKIDKKDGDEYVISQARKEYRIKAVIVENNPTFFEKISLKTQLMNILKENSKRTIPKTAEILSEFFEKEFLNEKELVDYDVLKVTLEACRQMYITTQNDMWLVPIHKLGWNVDGKGVFKDK